MPLYICGIVGLYLFALSSDQLPERGYHVLNSIPARFIGLTVVVAAASPGGKYAGLRISSLIATLYRPLARTWLAWSDPRAWEVSLGGGTDRVTYLA